MRRRLARILLNAATVASLVLCIATAVLWVRIYWGAESWAQTTSEAIAVNGIQSNRGSVSVFCGNPRFLVGAGATDTRWAHARGPVERRRAPDFGLRPVLGFAYRALPGGGGAVGVMPFGVVPLATAVLPAWRLACWCRRPRRRRADFPVGPAGAHATELHASAHASTAG